METVMTSVPAIKKLKGLVAEALVPQPGQGSHITAAESRGIVQQAEKGGVTGREGRVLVDLYDKAQVGVPASASSEVTTISRRGVSHLNALFVRHNIPGGENLEDVKTQIQITLGSMLWLGDKVARPRLSNLVPVLLQDGGSKEVAYVNPRTQQFHLEVTPKEGMEGPDGPGARYYGPFDLQKTMVTMAVPETPADAGPVNSVEARREETQQAVSLLNALLRQRIRGLPGENINGSFSKFSYEEPEGLPTIVARVKPEAREVASEEKLKSIITQALEDNGRSGRVEIMLLGKDDPIPL
jgi:hypothetical protein